MGSQTDQTYSPTGKSILGVFESREDAINHEMALHKEFDVAKNPLYANRHNTNNYWPQMSYPNGRSEEHCAKLSAAQTERMADPKRRQHLSELNKALPTPHWFYKDGVNNFFQDRATRRLDTWKTTPCE